MGLLILSLLSYVVSHIGNQRGPLLSSTLKLDCYSCAGTYQSDQRSRVLPQPLWLKKEPSALLEAEPPPAPYSCDSFFQGSSSHCCGRAVRGKHHSPVLKETLKLASEKNNLAPCGPITGHRQLKPNWFWESASGSGCYILFLSVEMDAAIPLPLPAGSAAPEKEAAKMF